MSNLYQEAILDAKTLRASAIANAKAALEEAFEPKIKEMLRHQLSEETDSDTVEAEVESKNSDFNEAELEEILTKLEQLSVVEETKNKSILEKDEAEMEDAEEAEDVEAPAEEAEEVIDEPVEDTVVADEIPEETKIIDITLGDLKQVLQAVMADQKELTMDAPEASEEGEAEISLDEILADLQKDDGETEVEKELEEAKATVQILRQSLQEVNLLNAKYLYMNKLFKSSSITESQKIKVINALDKANTVVAAKSAYETLKEAFSKKGPIRESVGYASQPAGIAPKTPIVDVDSFIGRWQVLAGIKKQNKN